MLARLTLYPILVGFVVLASCGGTAERKAAEEAIAPDGEEVIVDYDSLLRVMDVRYNALCDERRVALGELDMERRKALIEANDRACMEFQDSLEWLLQMQQ
jgi:hypothetical protein